MIGPAAYSLFPAFLDHRSSMCSRSWLYLCLIIIPSLPICAKKSFTRERSSILWEGKCFSVCWVVINLLSRWLSKSHFFPIVTIIQQSYTLFIFRLFQYLTHFLNYFAIFPVSENLSGGYIYLLLTYLLVIFTEPVKKFVLRMDWWEHVVYLCDQRCSEFEGGQSEWSMSQG